MHGALDSGPATLHCLTMSVIPNRDRRAERYQATKAEILAAAWDLVREQGLRLVAGLPVGGRVSG